MKPVAITGVGIACALGDSASEVLDAMRAHRSGAVAVDKLPAKTLAAFPRALADLDDFPDDRKTSLLARAVRDLLDADGIEPARRGVFLGTGLSSITPRELDEDIYPYVHDGEMDWRGLLLDFSTDRVAPRRHMPARATGWLASTFGAVGPMGTTFSACAAGAEAIAAGARAVARGDADVVLAGGHDSMAHPFGLLSFDVLGALSQDVCRPFDRRRDGFLLGEGAAVLRIEPLEGPRPPLAILYGAGTSLDAHGITAPHPEGRGAEASMRRALADAGVDPRRVSWVNAHGTGTPLGDRAEAMAVERVFGRVAVSSMKGAVGHTLAAAGAVEAALSIVALGAGLTPGTVGCEEPDEVGVDVVTHPRDTLPDLFVSNSFGFGGQNCSLVMGVPR